MDKFRFVAVFLGILVQSLTGLLAQSADSLIADLQAIHETVRRQPCSSPQLSSNRAMNLFLSDKIGRYLTDYKSLSFYKNFITLNVRDGVFSLNHNLFQPTGTDEPVRTFYVVGIKATVANALTAPFTEKTGANDLGATLKKTWIAKPKTRLTDCFGKAAMDVKRASDLTLLAQEIKEREEEFRNSLASINQENLTDADFAKAKNELYQNFYAKLTDEFSEKFAAQQYQELLATERYKRITTHWTNLSIYLPVMMQRSVVANSLTLATETRKSYPFELTVNHTQFWESKRSGRFFLSLEANVFLSNSIQRYSLERISYNQYKSLGGNDTLSLRQRRIDAIYVGNYQTFLTPAARLTVVYYPVESHIGISTTVEQYIGTYKALNWVIGIPVVLIDKKGAPASNFEFQLRYADCTHVVFPQRTFRDNISVNLTVGVPLSKIIY